jgi:hypothetical protein
MLESEHNNLQKEDVMKKVSNKFNAIVAGARNLFANAKSAVARKAGYVMIGTLGFGAPMLLATSCEKECDERDPTSECYIQPPVQKHTTTYTFDYNDRSVISPEDPRVQQSCDSTLVEKVILNASDGDSDWTQASPARFAQVADRLELKKSISPKVETTGTMTHQAFGDVFTSDSLRLVALGIKLPVK